MISVIVPVYNVEKYLSRCIESVITQSFRDWELLLIDDGSTDNSAKICEEYVLKDRRIKCFHKKNGGQSSARNLGLDNAVGNYIAFCDSDDWLSTNFLKETYESMIENESDIVTANYYNFFDENNISPVFSTGIKKQVCSNNQAMLRLLENDGTSSSVWGRLYKRYIFDEIRFQDGMLFEDAAISYKLFEKANQVTFISEPLMYYFRRYDSTMSRRDRKIRLDEIRAAYERYEGVKKNYDYDICQAAFSDYVYDMIHVIECFIRDHYDLDDLSKYEIHLREELSNHHYKIGKKYSLRKKIESFIWIISPKIFYFIISLFCRIKGKDI